MRLAALILLLMLLPGWAGADLPVVSARQDGRTTRLAEGVRLRAETILVRLEERTGLTPTGPIYIEIASSEKNFRLAQPGGRRVPSWAAGVAYPEYGLIVIKAPALIPGNDPDTLLAHELAHLVLKGLFRDRPAPHWLQEALAMRLSGERAWSRRVDMARTVMARRFIPLEALGRGFPGDRFEAETAYAESYYFLAFLENRYGAKACGRLIQNLALGVGLDNAVLQATGQRREAVEEAFRGWATVRFSFLSILAGSGVLWFLAALSIIPIWLRKRSTAARQMETWDEEEDSEPEPEPEPDLMTDWESPEDFPQPRPRASHRSPRRVSRSRTRRSVRHR